ncbi:Methionine aminopeptidase [compost metagenome]
MVFTIEPMLTEGSYYMTIDPDGWTARTIDGKLAAQYEHTIAILAGGPQILTAQ